MGFWYVCLWSETQLLDSKIGKYTTIVRKDLEERNCYLGVITNEEVRKLGIPLDFLDKGENHQAEFYADGPGADYKTNPYPVAISTKVLNYKILIDLDLAPGGGTAIKFTLIGK